MGTEIDWSKAPEGATHYAVDSVYPWQKHDGSGDFYWCADRFYWKKLGFSLEECRAKSSRLFIARPAAWTGAGLPPVGIEIEAMMKGLSTNSSYAFRRARVVHGPLDDSPREVLVFDVETTRPAWVDEFRPIRTAEQIAADEREAGIREIERIALSAAHLDGPFRSARALWDAGYRKP